MVLMWTASKTEVGADFLGLPTLGDMWRAVSSNPNFVKVADKKINRLDFFANVRYNPNADDEDGSELTVWLRLFRSVQ